jgi:hypothetical protein
MNMEGKDAGLWCETVGCLLNLVWPKVSFQ